MQNVDAGAAKELMAHLVKLQSSLSGVNESDLDVSLSISFVSLHLYVVFFLLLNNYVAVRIISLTW